jgi:hypothetical protein
MKTLVNYLSFGLLGLFFFIGINTASAQSQWTYSMSTGGVTYKIHFQQERGTLTVQLYDSKSNQWSWASMLESKPAPSSTSDTPGFYKFQAGGYTYQMWTYAASRSAIVKSGSSQWTYVLESTK